MNLRGVFTTGDDGSYSFETVRPSAYPIPGDGPVGALLRATGRHNWRPGHIHFLITAPGHEPVITHVFDAASDYLDSDAVFGVRPSLIVDMEGGEARFDPVLAPVVPSSAA
jgi:catechol 1,2-dioxygenase